MLYNSNNFDEARHLIGKKVIFWTDWSNVYTGILEGIQNMPFHFLIDRRTMEIYIDKKGKYDAYLNEEFSKCFQYIKSLEDGNGNLTFDFY